MRGPIGLLILTLVTPLALGRPMPASARGVDLQYLGGPIMGNPTVYTIFWLPPGRHFEQDPGRDSAYEVFINGFITDLDGSPYARILRQYSRDTKGHPIPGGPITGHVTLGGTWVDTAPYPHAGTSADPLLAADLRPEIERAMARNGWSPSLHTVYAVYLAADINYCSTADGVCADIGLGGAHYIFTSGDDPLLAIALPDIYSFSFNRAQSPSSENPEAETDLYAGLMAAPTAHELMETITDPMVGVQGLDGLDPAWRREKVFGSEIADACQEYQTTMTVGTRHYLVPALYSNARHACVFSHPALPLHLTLATKRVRAGQQQTLRVTSAAGSHVAVHIQPGNRVIHAQADSHGTYLLRWTPKRASHTQITVTSAASDGRAGLSLTHFAVAAHSRVAASRRLEQPLDVRTVHSQRLFDRGGMQARGAGPQSTACGTTPRAQAETAANP